MNENTQSDSSTCLRFVSCLRTQNVCRLFTSLAESIPHNASTAFDCSTIGKHSLNSLQDTFVRIILPTNDNLHFCIPNKEINKIIY